MDQKITRLIAALTLLLFITSCQKDISDGTSVGTNAAVAYSDVSYGADALQKMDVYLPAGRSAASTRVIVMIHGGAWASGDKVELAPFVDTLKRRFPTYALFNINYRLSAAPTNVFPTQENDVKAALEFIYGKSAQYGICDKWALMGASAGGHLALLQAYKYSSPVKPRAVVSLAGPTDLNDLYNNPAGGNFLLQGLLASAIGKTPLQDAALYNSSSPVNFVSSVSPPTLLLYGSVDPLVAPNQAVLLRNKLQIAGVPQEYMLFNGSAHVDTWSNAVFFTCFEKTQAFFAAHLQ